MTDLRVATRRLPAKAQICEEGEHQREIYVIRSGWAFRYKILFDGSRQVLDFLLPGELVGLPFNDGSPYMDYSVETATKAAFCVYPLDAVLDLSQSDPSFASTLMWMTSNEKARAYQRITDLGRRNARERVAHFLLDIFYRLCARGGIAAESCDFPITQCLMADALGLSAVHVNRVIRQLREARIAAIAGQVLTIFDLEQLEDICDYNSSYLDQGFPTGVGRAYIDHTEFKAARQDLRGGVHDD